MTITKDNIEEYKKIYLDIDDPLEYSFYSKYFSSLEDWETLCNTSFFKPIILQWRKELEVRLRSKALRALREVALGDTRDSFIANKYLLDNFSKKETKGRGRPSKQEVLSEATRLASEEDRLKQDYNLITNSKG